MNAVPLYVYQAKYTDIDVILGNVPYGPCQPGTIHKFVYWAGEQYKWLWSFSYTPLKRNK